MSRRSPFVMSLIGAGWTVLGLFSDGIDKWAAYGLATMWLVGAWIVTAIIEGSRS